MFNYPVANETKCPSCGSKDFDDFVPLGAYIPKAPIDLEKDVPVLRYIYKCCKCGNRFEADWGLPKGPAGRRFQKP